MNLDDPRTRQIASCSTIDIAPQLVKQFGTLADFERAVHEVQAALHSTAA
jgi:hypothetical protein